MRLELNGTSAGQSEAELFQEAGSACRGEYFGGGIVQGLGERYGGG